jgi:hypothetical protein
MCCLSQKPHAASVQIINLFQIVFGDGGLDESPRLPLSEPGAPRLSKSQSPCMSVFMSISLKPMIPSRGRSKISFRMTRLSVIKLEVRRQRLFGRAL